MDTMLKREFVHVHVNASEGNALSEAVLGELMRLNRFHDCTVTEYGGTVTIACQGLRALGALAAICTIREPERGTGYRSDTRLFGALRQKLVDFIG